jgi:hypothetical protein
MLIRKINLTFLKQQEGDFTNSGCRSDARSIASEFFYCCENIAMEDDGFELEYMGTSLNNEMIGRRFRIFQLNYKVGNILLMKLCCMKLLPNDLQS